MIHLRHSWPSLIALLHELSGVKKLGFNFTLMMAGYNLIRLPKLFADPAWQRRCGVNLHKGQRSASQTAPINFQPE